MRKKALNFKNVLETDFTKQYCVLQHVFVKVGSKLEHAMEEITRLRIKVLLGMFFYQYNQRQLPAFCTNLLAARLVFKNFTRIRLIKIRSLEGQLLQPSRCNPKSTEVQVWNAFEVSSYDICVPNARLQTFSRRKCFVSKIKPEHKCLPHYVT